MRFRELRQLVQQIVVAGLPAVVGCTNSIWADEADCGVKTERSDRQIGPDLEPQVRLRAESCRLDIDACMDLCREVTPGQVQTCKVEFPDDRVRLRVSYLTGSVCTSNEPSGVGRKPAGLVQPAIGATTAAGVWLAHAAWLEAASVHAFLHLAHELELHGAPRALIKLAIAAARDEVRHAAVVGALARQYGATPPTPEIVTPGPRTLEDLALENAVEGCVHETFGAVVAAYQAHTARDPHVRGAFRRIALDEARHGALAWSIDEWVAPRLATSARERVVRARDAAIVGLSTSPVTAVPELGLPAPTELAQLLSRTRSTMWQGGAA